MKRPFTPTTPVTMSNSHYASHAYHFCQLTNGRAGWPAETQIKDAAKAPRVIHSVHFKKRTAIRQASKQEEQPEPTHQVRRAGCTQQRAIPACATKGVIVSATNQKGVMSLDTTSSQEGADLYSLRAASKSSACHGPPRNSLRTGRQPACRTIRHVHMVLPSGGALIAQTYCTSSASLQ
jgi:hypothetical protein